MAAYKAAVSAAGKINFDMYRSGNTVYASASTPGYGNITGYSASGSITVNT